MGPGVLENEVGGGGVAVGLPDVADGAQQVGLVQVPLQVELQVHVVVEGHQAHARGVLADLEHGDHVLHEAELAPEVGPPDAVGGVQQEGHVRRLVAAVLP